MVLYWYIVLTHGPKPTGKIDRHPAAQAQIANLKAHLKTLESEVQPLLRFDYRRKIRGLASLPELAHVLIAMRENGTGAILMDDIARLFAACEEERRKSFLTELLEYREQLAGLKQRGLLANMTETQLAMLASGRETTRYTYGGKRPRNNMSERDRKQQTVRATIASRKARGQAADDKARELADLRNKLTTDNKTPTLKMIANEANNRGITTTRGGPWSSSTVGRMLKRLEETKQTERTTHDEAQEER